MSRTRNRVKCASCGERIPNHEPDVVLRRLGQERERYYHSRCAGAALERATAHPDVWFVTVRDVDAEAN